MIGKEEKGSGRFTQSVAISIVSFVRKYSVRCGVYSRSRYQKKRRFFLVLIAVGGVTRLGEKDGKEVAAQCQALANTLNTE